MSRDYFIEQYGDEYLDQMKQLEKQITEQETGKEKITAKGIEAGLGKSIETNSIVTNHVNVHKAFGRKYCLVKPFISDVIRSTAFMNDNSKINGPIALGVTHENWDEIRQNLDQILMYPVVIITHARYLQLSLEPSTRQYFERGRHTLIIDEQLQVPMYDYSEQKYKQIKGSLPSRDMDVDFIALTQDLSNEITRLSLGKSNQIMKAKLQPVDIELLKRFERSFKANYYRIGTDADRNRVENFINFLHCIESNNCLFNGGRLRTFNKGVRRWTLTNNIILDANAGIDRRHLLDPDVVIDSPAKIIDLSDTAFHHVPYNSSQSSIKQTQMEFHKMICKLITDKHGKDDKTLIVTHSIDDEQVVACLKELGHTRIGVGVKYLDEDIAVAHFGAIIGQNYWRDFNKVWVIATPNYPYEAYPLYWSSSTQSPIRNHSLKTVRAKGYSKFQYTGFESIRHGSIVSDIYQAVRRINRQGRLKSEVYVVNSNQEVIQEVIEQLKNVKVGNDITLEIKRPKKVNTAPPKDTKAFQFVSLIKQLGPGTYGKRELYDLLGWKYDRRISYFLNDKDILDMKQAGLIDWNRSTITIHSRLVAK